MNPSSPHQWAYTNSQGQTSVCVALLVWHPMPKGEPEQYQKAWLYLYDNWLLYLQDHLLELFDTHVQWEIVPAPKNLHVSSQGRIERKHFCFTGKELRQEEIS